LARQCKAIPSGSKWYGWRSAKPFYSRSPGSPSFFLGCLCLVRYKASSLLATKILLCWRIFDIVSRVMFHGWLAICFRCTLFPYLKGNYMIKAQGCTGLSRQKQPAPTLIPPIREEIWISTFHSCLLHKDRLYFSFTHGPNHPL